MGCGCKERREKIKAWIDSQLLKRGFIKVKIGGKEYEKRIRK